MRVSRLMTATLVALGALSMSTGAFAQFSGNVTLASEYLYRGITQSKNDPALQLTLDYAHESGFYIGTFLSSIKWTKEAAKSLRDSGYTISTNNNLEWDIYGGYKFSPVKDLTLDIGYLRYEYPGKFDGFDGRLGALKKPNTDEIYLGATYGPVSFKYSHAISDLFGTADSKGSQYYDLSYSQEIYDKLTLGLHIGQQKYKGNQRTPSGPFDNNLFTYTDYRAQLTYDFGGGFNATAGYSDTNADSLYFTINGVDTGKGRAYLLLTKTF